MPKLKVVDFFQVFGQHFFIGGHHGFSVLQGGLNDLKGSGGIIDHFHYDIDFRIVEDVRLFVGEDFRGQAPFLFTVFHPNFFYLCLDPLRFFQHVIQALPHTTEAK